MQTADRLALIRQRYLLRRQQACKHDLLPEECADCRVRQLPTLALVDETPHEADPSADQPPETAQEHALAVARSLGQPFGLTALVLACWRTAPELFGLAGCEQHHPDARRVATCLFGRKGLLARGLIGRTDDGLFCIPPLRPPAA